MIYSMTRMQGSRYLMHTSNHTKYNNELYCVDIDTLKADRLEMTVIDITLNVFVDGEYMIVVIYDRPMRILRNLQDIGQIEFRGKYEICKNYEDIHGRYAQQVGRSVYALDNGGRLFRIEWQDIKDGKYDKTFVKSSVENFYVDRRLGLATINLDHTLSFASETEVDLGQKIDSKVIWTIVTCFAKCWIVSGDRDSQAIMASISKKSDIRSTLKLMLTSNGYKNYRDRREYRGICSLHQAYVRGRRGIMLAIERDGCCHLISVHYGRLSKIESIDSIVNVDVIEHMQHRVVKSVTATGAKDVFIVGGHLWTKKITIKLK